MYTFFSKAVSLLPDFIVGALHHRISVTGRRAHKAAADRESLRQDELKDLFRKDLDDMTLRAARDEPTPEKTRARRPRRAIYRS